MELYNTEASNLFSAIKNGEVYKAHNKSIVIAGDCTSGKSSIVRELLSMINNEKCGYIHFIDSSNRNVMPRTDSEVSSMTYFDFEPYAILAERYKNRGLYDLFPGGIYGGTVTYFELLNLFEEKEYQELAKKYISKDLELLRESSKNPEEEHVTSAETMLISGLEERMENVKRILVNDGKDLGTLSSSEACILRMALEIKYASQKKCKVVIIDELDSHLDSKTLGTFINLITEDFSNIRFILVTHRISDLLEVHDMDALVLVKAGDEIVSSRINCDDYSEIGHIERIRERIRRGKREGKLLEECVSILVKQEKLPDKFKEELERIEISKLTTKERVLLSYIRRCMNDVC